MVPLRGTILSGAKPHHGTRVDSADPRGEAPGSARHSAMQPAPSPLKKLTPGTQCLLFGPTPAGFAKRTFAAKAGPKPWPVLRPWFFAWDQPFSGEAGHPAFAHGMWGQAS